MKVGLITYHSAYNFGSVLQAYATESVLNQLGCETVVLNYRIPFQKKFYGLLGYGEGIIKAPIKKLLMLPQLSKRIIRKNKYEKFISKMNLSKEINSPYEFNNNFKDFDLFVSGSDQIWNLHSNEFINSGKEYMDPYLLSFTNKRKVSYASSIVNMTDDELLSIKDKLEKFDYISCREQLAVERLNQIITKKASKVIDPTFLLTSENWGKLAQSNKIEKNYILYYSLKGFRNIRKDLIKLSNLSEKYDMQVIALTPLAPVVHKKNVINFTDAGPVDFLTLIKNASLVVTDSYHGMLFSINFRKEFYYLKNVPGANFVRTDDVLSLLDLNSRIIKDVNLINIYNKVNYDFTDQKLPVLREESINYLKNAINPKKEPEAK